MNRSKANCLATLALLLIGPGTLPAWAATPADLFSTLRAAPADTDLPDDTASTTALTGRMRPTLAYPTLHLDKREPRVMQQAEAPPVAAEVDAGSDFETLVRQTLGQSLPVFGRELFDGNRRGFEPVDEVNVPADFVLGPGDEIYLRAWGSVDIDYRATVDRTGAIVIPKVGEVPVSGVRFGDLREHLRAAIARSFHGFELSVSLGQLHSIRVYVTGFARAPGSYTVNALSSLVNVLFYAGGPGQAGDLRRVELRRSGELLTTIDFYDFLLHGRHDNDLRLLPEDVIHVPALAAQAAIAGAVNRPGIYQLAGADTLSDLIAYAGEPSVSASTHRVVLERIGANNDRVVEEYPLSGPALDLALRDGDLVLIQPVSPRFRNAVTLRGHVAQPLRHEWRPGMRVTDLLPTSDALISPHYWSARLARSQVVHLLNDAPDTNIAVAPSDINWEYAVIERIDPVSLRTQLLPIHLGKAMQERDPAHDLELRPGDQLTVFSLGDFRTRTAQRPHFVRIEGEVQRAGIYPVGPRDTIGDLIARSGGLTEDSFIYGIELKREAVRRRQQLRIDEAIDQLEQDYQRHLIERSRNVLTGDLSLAITPEAAAIGTLINRLRDAEPSGRIVLDLAPTIRNAAELPNLTLAGGDEIFVPRRPATIEVVGAVYRQGSILYGAKKLDHYIDKVGLLATADKRNVYLIRPDGSFLAAGRRTALNPGDTIIVPEKVDRESTVRRIKDWSQVLYQFGLGAAGLALLDVF